MQKYSLFEAVTFENYLGGIIEFKWKQFNVHCSSSQVQNYVT